MKNFNEIYSENHPIVLSFIMKNNKIDLGLAEEIANDVFMKVHDNLHKYDCEKAKLLTWILNITKNACIDEFRRRKLNTESISKFVDENGNEFITTVESSNPMQDFILSEVDNAISDSFTKLPAKLRAVADLYFNVQLSYNEISDNLNLPLGTVKANIHRARTLLQGTLENVKNSLF